MNPQYFSESTSLLLERQSRTENLQTAECLEAIAACIRIIANTDPTIGKIIWTAVQLCRGAASFRIALILERFARDIRLKVGKENGKSIVGAR